MQTRGTFPQLNDNYKRKPGRTRESSGRFSSEAGAHQRLKEAQSVRKATLPRRTK